MIYVVIAVGLFAVFVAWVLWANSALKLSRHSVSIKNLPDSFSGFRIIQISDLHNDEFGKDNGTLLGIIKESKPDIIVFTGDLIDCRRPDIGVSLKFAENAIKIAPCYYVTGNHEARIPEYTEAKEDFRNLGVTLLENEGVLISRENGSILLAGVDDPRFKEDSPLTDCEVMENQLKELSQKNLPSVLLSHRPELFEVYTEHNFDLVLCGHTHGGHFRFPLVGGLWSPYQGFFPKYDAGRFSKNNTEMIVCRGLKKSSVPPRFLNRPEIILVELNKK